MAKKNERKAEDPAFGSIARNRQAFHNYEVLSKLECGLELTGTEVKSLREGQVAFADSFALVQDGELFLYNLNISEYRMGNRFNHLANRKRRLLAHKREIRKLGQAVDQRGLTLVPLGMHWSRGLAKLELGLVRGKQMHDKRETLRRKDQRRDEERARRGLTKG
ncbi:MAG: SsrA-binding protein SmpB [Planctomycetota bacterium]|nr:SsrA-binding protein SmpB [Planctomycetota bacterium]